MTSDRKMASKKRPAKEKGKSPSRKRNNLILPHVPSSRSGKATSKPPRYKPPARYLKEIRDLQSTTNTLIPAAPFARLVREITVSVTTFPDLRFQKLALKALHEASEAYIVGLMEDSYLLTLHRQRITLMAKDLRLAQRIRGDFGRLNV